jgi:PIN domain
MLYVLADTSVWLDLAKDVNGQKLIVAVQVLVHDGRLTLVVPQLVIDEFDRNRSRVEADMTRSMSANLRRVRDEIEQFGQQDRDAALAELDNMALRVPLIKQIATRNLDDVRDLLAAGHVVTPTSEDQATVIRWALEKRAPFHRSRNSVADALLLAMYRTAMTATDAEDCWCFVSANVKDFSAVNGDNRQPHPDLAALFDRSQSHYFLSLVASLDKHFPDEFDDMLDEFDFREDPRNWEEIHEAEEELFDRIWYQRSLNHEYDAGVDLEELQRIAGPGRARVEAKYGIETLGPYSDFEWGMLNGKLSALRWVTGSEWDFLDT